MNRRLRVFAMLMAVILLSGMLTVGASVSAAAAEEDLPYYIMVNRRMNTVTVYTQDVTGAYTVPYKAMI